MKEENFNFLWLLKICTNNIKLLSVIFILTLLSTSVIVVFFVDSKFESSVIIYPTTTSSVSQALLVEHNPYRKDVLEFGEEEQAEELLQILNSDAIRDSIINKYNLYNHYGINLKDNFHKTTINTIYDGLIKIKKTQFNSIKITVLDTSPQLAADIANSYLDFMDSVLNSIRKERSTQSLEILEARKKILYNQRNNVQDSLSIYRSYGVLSSTAQTERLTEQYALALSQNNTSGSKKLKLELNNLAQYAGMHDVLLRKSHKIEEELMSIQFEFDRVSIDINYTLENKFVINKAYPADKKSYPVRWLIVLSALLSVLTFTILILSILDSMRNVNNEQLQ